MRWELEDLAFKHLEPDEYKALAKQVAQKRGEREELIAQLREPLDDAADAGGHPGRRRHGPAEAPLVDLQEDEAAREAVRGDLRPPRDPRARQQRCPTATTRSASSTTAGRRCRSASRTTSRSRSRTAISRCTRRCSGRARQLFEIQIRTREMHRTADFGIAAHWLYKEDATSSDELDRHLAWFRQVLELQLDAKTPDEFLEFLKLDLYQDEIFVFTPTGDVIQLPKGATPIDFAFAVHTEVGLHCAGREGQRPHRAAVTRRCGTRRRSRSSPSPTAQAEPRLAGARAHRAARATRSGSGSRHEEQPSSAKLGQEILDRELKRRRLAKPDDDAARRRPRARSNLERRDAPARVDRAGRRQRRRRCSSISTPICDAKPEPAQADARSSGSSTACAAAEGRAHPGRRRADGALRAVLPAGARAIRSSAT